MVFALTLAGCTETEPNTDALDELQTQLDEKMELLEDAEELIATLEALTEELESVVSDKTMQNQELHSRIITLGVEIDVLEGDIEELQEMIFDNVVTFTFDDGMGTYESSTVAFNDDYEGNLFDLLEENYAVQSLNTEYGKMLTGVEFISTMSGNYISFGKNGEMSMVGVESATFDDDDIFSFELVWWDMEAKAVYDSIQLFVDNQAENFVSDTVLDYNVVIALDMLGVLEDFVTVSEVNAQIDPTSMTAWNEYVKAAYILDAIGEDNSALITALNTDINTVPTYGYPSAYNAMKSFGETESNFASFETTVLAYYMANTPYDSGVDGGGSAIAVLSNYDTTEYNALVDAYTTWIHDDQLASGGFTTRDSVWGETTYPGTENAASMSQIILGLLANGIDPTGVDYTQTTNNLVTRVIEFQNTDGSFDYLYGDENADLMFSTPQAFLALVAFQEYLNNGNTAVNPYIQ
jgi:hypothetical protein